MAIPGGSQDLHGSASTGVQVLGQRVEVVTGLGVACAVIFLAGAELLACQGGLVWQHACCLGTSTFLFTYSERKQEACGNISQAGGLSKLLNLDGSWVQRQQLLISDCIFSWRKDECIHQRTMAQIS